MDMRMTSIRICQHQRYRMMAAGCFLCVAGLVAWSAATASGKARVTLPRAAVLVSTSTLDMSRLLPAQFGDWDTAAAQPAR
jgi:hypothetical protein